MEENKIAVQVFYLKEGIRTFQDVDMIRITSSKYTLLIMKDYMPVLGEVTGNVEILSGEDAERFESIHGFYIHKANNFQLLIDEDEYVR